MGNVVFVDERDSSVEYLHDVYVSCLQHPDRGWRVASPYVRLETVLIQGFVVAFRRPFDKRRMFHFCFARDVPGYTNPIEIDAVGIDAVGIDAVGIDRAC